MRKLFCIIACLIALSACGKKPSDVRPVTSGLSFTCEIENGRISKEIAVKAERNGNTEMRLLNDCEQSLTYYFSGSDVTLEFDGLKYKTEITALPSGVFCDFLYYVLSTVNKSQGTVYLKDGRYYLSDNSGRYSFTLYFAESGLPLEITDEVHGLTAIIKDVTITE